MLTTTLLFVMLASANVATPLVRLLEQRLSIDAVGITAAFASYVFSLMVTLRIVRARGKVSPRIMFCLATVGGVVACVVLAHADSLAWYCGGRILQGASLALVTIAASGAIRDVMPDRPRAVARVNLIASSGGVAMGPILGGLLSLLPAPLSTPFITMAAMIAVLGIAVVVLEPPPYARTGRIAKDAGSHPDRASRDAVRVAAATGFVSFALFGFSLSLAPVFLVPVMGTESRPMIGLLCALPILASAASQLLPFRHALAQPVGLAVMALGLLAVGASALGAGAVAAIAGVFVAGVGVGVAFQAAFTSAVRLTPPEHHSRAVSDIYTITYLGSAVPVLALGLLAAVWGLSAAVAIFSGVFAVAAFCGAAHSIVSRGSLRRRLANWTHRGESTRRRGPCGYSRVRRRGRQGPGLAAVVLDRTDGERADRARVARRGRHRRA